MNKILICLLLLAAACNQPAKKQEPQPVPAPAPMSVSVDSSKEELKNLAFDSKTDLVCGMPVRAGIADTVTYKGKLYGFCAKECKDEFLKDPQQYLTSK